MARNSRATRAILPILRGLCNSFSVASARFCSILLKMEDVFSKQQQPYIMSLIRVVGEDWRQ
ncbi:MAG: hypothetical protein N2A42_08845 [Luteolibacter sp.]